MALVTSSQSSIHMNGGEGETSYAKNSTVQRRIQQKMRPLVEEAIADLCQEASNVPRSIGIADVGCSSGPNALSLVSTAVDAVHRHCQQLHAVVPPRPELRVFLNDLPDNDFNTVFKCLPAFLSHQKQNRGSDFGPIFVFGVPGSFFGRLLPGKTLHLVCSSFSLHWLSKVPEELEKGGLINKGNITAGRTSPPAVIEAYARQFKEDFTLFLESRAEEVVAGGWMVISLKGRSAKDPRSKDCRMYDHPNSVLNDMASRDLIDEEKLDSYNIPAYDPCLEEMRETIEAEGSFEIIRMESYETMKDGNHGATGSTWNPGAYARVMRAVHEPMLTRHFGAGIDVDEFVRTAEKYLDRLYKQGNYRGALIHIVSLRRYANADVAT